MADQLILSVQEAHIHFGPKVLFEDLSFNIHAGSKVCLIGKNGAGKTTLMNIVSGKQVLDSGKRWQALGVRIGHLVQEGSFDKEQTVFDYIFSALPKEKQNDDNKYMVSVIAEPLHLNANDKMHSLSGGQLRRADLACCLIENPDLLLLDEPTNHLDFAAIKWLENYIRSYKGALLCVSHDRTFLRNVSDKVFWLDRGKIRVCSKGYAYFDQWSQALLEQEERELENRQKVLEIEEKWANRGVKARRKRNVRRLENVKAEREKLKADTSLFRQTMSKMELAPLTPQISSKMVAEFIKVSKAFDKQGEKQVILDQFNLRIIKGDKIGILGNNGSGKTTFLKLLIGQLAADSGKVKLAKNIQFSYFDQKRSNLDPRKSLWQTLTETGDYIDVMGKRRHVCGYLKDFLFDPKSAKDLVGTLSGGQKNRLMLAKTLANPGNCLILDEPTNDLDMDTLDILEDILFNYKGTLLVVSHDRDFLDQTVNKILAFEGDGNVDGYIGGYSDYLEAKKQKSEKIKIVDSDNNVIKTPPVKNTKKLTYKLQYELDNLPKKIEKLNDELQALNQQFSDPDFIKLEAEFKNKILTRSKELQEELESLEERWLELEEMKEKLDNS